MGKLGERQDWLRVPQIPYWQPRSFGLAGTGGLRVLLRPISSGSKAASEPMVRFRAFNALDSFITAALTMMVPLSLSSRGVSLVEIGGIVALMPFVFTLSRLLFAAVADGVGTRPFFILNAAANAGASFLYMNASTATTYASGRFLEGLRGGAIWAVNRLEALELTKERRVENEYAKLVAIRVLTYAIGTLAAGYIAYRLGFEGGFFLLALVSLVALALSFTIGSGVLQSESLRTMLSRLDFRKKGKDLWRMSRIMLVGMPATSLPLNLLLPIYLSAAGFGYGEIGVALAFYYLVGAIIVPVALRFEKSAGKISLYCGVFYAGGIALLPFMTGEIYIPILLMAIGDGLGSIAWEGIIAKGARGSKNQATDVGFMHVPAHMFTALMLALSGAIAQFFGFIAAFYMCGALMLLYGALASRELG